MMNPYKLQTFDPKQYFLYTYPRYGLFWCHLHLMLTSWIADSANSLYVYIHIYIYTYVSIYDYIRICRWNTYVCIICLFTCLCTRHIRMCMYKVHVYKYICNPAGKPTFLQAQCSIPSMQVNWFTQIRPNNYFKTVPHLENQHMSWSKLGTQDLDAEKKTQHRLKSICGPFTFQPRLDSAWPSVICASRSWLQVWGGTKFHQVWQFSLLPADLMSELFDDPENLVLMKFKLSHDPKTQVQVVWWRHI